jgi:predicted DCC family thiol-disulfide oxidoreductase YuxK
MVKQPAGPGLGATAEHAPAQDLAAGLKDLQPPQPLLTVLYDGACPLCRREIALYRGLQPLRTDAPVCFVDASDTTLALPPSTTREQLLARFHVLGREGQWLSGAQAFLALWAALPGWRWLALAGRLPGATWLLERGYRLFLRGRPVLQRWAARLDRPHTDPHDPHDPAPRAPLRANVSDKNSR